MHVAVSPVFLGEGENLFKGINLLELGYNVEENISTENATHLIIKKEN